MNKEIIPTPADHRKTFERILHKMSKDADHSFLSCVFQSMNTMFVNYIPTAGVCFNQKSKLFELRINPNFFEKELKDDKERVAVMIHEVYHILHKHVFVPPEKLENLNRTQLNVAMDLTINQLIANLPDMCWTIEKLRDKNKKPFEKNLTFEEYYDLLDEAEMKCPKCGKDMKMNGKGTGDKQEGQGEGSESKTEGKGKGKGKGNKGEKGDSISEKCDGHGEGEPCEHQGQGSGNGQPGEQSESSASGGKCDHKGEWRKVDLKDYDKHDWTDADIKERLDATRDLIKRAIQKNSYSHSRVPDFVQDCLEKVESAIKKLNYKEILLRSLRQSLPSKDTTKSWKRPSRRYGDICKGNVSNKLPMIAFHGDTSGSISHEELNEFLKVTMNFFTVGVSKAWFHLFHTQLYYKAKITKSFKLNVNDVQSGGTDLEPSFKDIAKNKPDLAVILTDGYYGAFPLPKNMPTNIVWVISKNGNKEHPFKNIGLTVTY